jgi:uncharacterized membrane protein
MMSNNGQMSGWGWTWMSFGMLAGWLVLLVALFLVVRHYRVQRATDAVASLISRPKPFDVLAARFASGEIDVEEFQRRSATLREELAAPARESR